MLRPRGPQSQAPGREQDAIPGISVLDEKGMIPIILYLMGNEGCLKTQIYAAVSRGARMPDKLDRLESAGLVSMSASEGSRAVSVSLTDLGRDVGEELRSIERLVGAEGGTIHE